MTDRLSFTVPGEPVGKGRPRFGKGRTYTPAKTRSYEAAVALHARAAMRGLEPFTGACSISVTAYMPIPRSWGLKAAREALGDSRLPTGRPDADNLLKAACDGCNGIVWRDDAQATEARIIKRYSDRPRLEISIVHIEAKERGVEIVPKEAA